jgi:hypothetical protein
MSSGTFDGYRLTLKFGNGVKKHLITFATTTNSLGLGAMVADSTMITSLPVIGFT